MKIRRFYAKDMRDAMNQVKQELGRDAVIMSKTKLDDGIEIVAAYDEEPKPQSKPTLNMTPRAQAALPKGGFSSALTSAKREYGGQGNTNSKTPTLSEIIGDQGPDSLKALLNREQAPSKVVDNGNIQTKQTASEEMDTKTPASQTVSKNPTVSHQAMDELKDELSSLRNVLQFQVTELFKEKSAQEKPQLQYLRQQLQQMGLSTTLVTELLSYAPDNVSERDAWVFLLKLLSHKVKVPSQNILQTGGVVSLLGATGAGKTTTIAKLAAQFAARHGADSVAMVTIDSYRIAAYEQLATYGKIIGCTVKKAASANELTDIIGQLKHKKLVLIDTAGFGQRDSRLITQCDTLNAQTCVKIKHYMVLPANAQKQALIQSLKSYDGLSVEGCILSKIDETYSLGEALSVLIEQQLPACFITDGQKVPEDLKLAESKYLVSTSAKLYQQYNKVEQPKVMSQ